MKLRIIKFSNRGIKVKLAKKAFLGIIISSLMIGGNIYAAVLHQQTNVETITKGATLIQEKMLIDEGWRYINMLKVDLDEPNIEIRPIESSTGTTRQTVLQLVKDAGAVAGVNSDFFDLSSNSASFGPVIENGELKHAYNSNYSSLGPNKNMATFIIDNNNTPLMAYYGVSIRINGNGSLVGAASSYNIVPGTLTRPVILDSSCHKSNSAAVEKKKNAYTIVVENNQVVDHSTSDEYITIPENGYLIVLPETIANEYYSKLPIGTNVDLDIRMYLQDGVTTAIEELKLGIGGGGLIMKNGAEYTGAAHKITPTSKDPRTVIATLKGSNEILLITIDGRGSYKGMTHSDLVSFLKSYNVENAMYFDGGGSTTMVARNEGETEATLQNNPSDGSMRKVANGLGVFTTNETGMLSKLIIEPNHKRSFVGEKISFTVKGTDENSNPVTINPAEITFSVAGVEGDFNGTSFTATSAGKALIMASVNGVEVGTEVYISNIPKGIRVEPSLIQLGVGASKEVKVYGVDEAGYSIPLSSDAVTWTSDQAAISGKNNTVYGNASAVGTLTANYKGVTANVGVVIGNSAVAIESFEENNASWAGDTSTVKGKVEPNKTVKYHGNRSLKMTYTFDKSSTKQVAYTLFNKPIEITADARSINLWVNAKKQGHTAKLEVVDATGKKYYLKLTDQLNFDGWKYLSATLPEEMQLPAKVTKFYVYANEVSEKVTTAVYIDHVSITRGIKCKTGINQRADEQFDSMYKETLQNPTGTDQYMINIIGQTAVSSMKLSNSTVAKISKQLSDGAGVVVLADSKNSALTLSPKTYTYNNTYQVADYNTTRIIMVGTNSGGIRATNSAAWLNMKTALQNSTAKNIILIMSKDPLTGFDDIEEGKALHDYLKEQREQTGKNIFVVVSSSAEEEVRIQDGIRYIRVNGINTVTDNVADSSFVKFKIVGDKLYYTIESLNIN